jgi:hypothetical protein
VPKRKQAAWLKTLVTVVVTAAATAATATTATGSNHAPASEPSACVVIESHP